MFLSRENKSLKICLGVIPLNCVRLSRGHVLIVGKTGSGKTNTVKVIIEEVISRNPGIKFLILDWAGEYNVPGFKKLLPGENFEFDLISFQNKDKTQHIDFVVDIFSSLYNLTEPQAYILYKALKRMGGNIKLRKIVEAIESLDVRNYKELDVKTALLRRLEPLNDGILGKVLNGDIDFGKIYNDNVIVDLHKVEGIRHRTLLSLIILRKIYEESSKRSFKEGIKHFTVIEEAWTVVPYRRREEYPSIGERLFLELRKYGECLIAVVQSIGDISERAVKNSNLILVHRVLPRDIEALGRIFSEIDRLPQKQGEALAITEEMEIKIVKVRKSRLR